MPQYLKRPAFSAAAATDTRVADVVRDVIADVETNGDDAVRRYSEKFDHWSPPSFRLTPDAIASIVATVSPTVLDDIR
jgi:sulfopropanediol 3-dehydrogenase